MRLIQAICGLAFVVAAGCASDGPPAPSTEGSSMSMPGDDGMPMSDEDNMGMNTMGMPGRERASCEASGGVCATQQACNSSRAHMISAMCPASQSCCVSN